MDETVKQVFTFLGTAGGAAFLVLIGKGIAKIWTGTAQRERVKTTSLVTRTESAEKKKDDAEAETEKEIKLRRKAEHHVALLQRQIVLLGAKPTDNDYDN
jgi:hypothetical protein